MEANVEPFMSVICVKQRNSISYQLEHYQKRKRKKTVRKWKSNLSTENYWLFSAIESDIFLRFTISHYYILFHCVHNHYFIRFIISKKKGGVLFIWIENNLTLTQNENNEKYFAFYFSLFLPQTVDHFFFHRGVNRRRI